MQHLLLFHPLSRHQTTATLQFPKQRGGTPSAKVVQVRCQRRIKGRPDSERDQLDKTPEERNLVILRQDAFYAAGPPRFRQFRTPAFLLEKDVVRHTPRTVPPRFDGRQGPRP